MTDAPSPGVEMAEIEPETVQPQIVAGVVAVGTGGSRQTVTHRRVSIARLSVLTAVVVIAADQVTKNWAIENLADGREHHVIWTLQWNLAFNSGMAFSRGRGLGPFIAVLAFAVVIALVVSSARVGSRLGRVAAGLLIGGAFGNLLDRAFRGDGWLNGAVIDFIDMQWWPIFNIADMGVTIGAVLFMLASLLETRRRA